MKKNILGILELLAGILLVAGSLTFFSVCPEGEHFMTCHWAKNAVILLGVVLTLQAALRIIIPDERTKLGISLAELPLSVAAALIPQNIIALCMMETMRCHTVFKPAVRVTASVLVLIIIADIVLLVKDISKKRGAGK